MKFDNIYHLEYSDYYLHCYTLNILADMSFGFLKVLHVELGNLLRTLN